MVEALPRMGASSMTTLARAERTYCELSAASSLTHGKMSLTTCKSACHC